MELTGKQRRHLRSLANRVKATVHVGKEGVSEAILAVLAAEFTHRELVKISVNQNAAESAREMGQSLAEAANAHWVQTIGRTVVLYQPLDEPEIKLPSG